ncbi:GGDEF domain-containing protein [Breznakiella homolactica]|uniref:diguanylate cyclase n=1 Tax=Breznakiella homolactica TaxID=2798577 RepID=A0A7T7XRH8_9SPIR|nr:GGDEF domain-containing protein [Breznakiella homolactica]QQO11171.1 GGDEF domain-containing protein [Breznakiella homolactica]
MNTNSVRINRICEFENKKLEHHYLEEYGNRTKKILRIMVLVSGSAYFAIVLFDFFYLGDFYKVLPSLVSRSAILLCSAALFSVANRVKSFNRYAFLLTVYEALLYVSYMGILYEQRAQGFMQQAMALIVVILLIFAVPNRWIYCVVCSLFTVGLFFFLTPRYIENLKLYQQIEALIYLIIVLCLAAIFIFRSNYFQRIQFVKESQLEILSVTDKLTRIYNRSKFDESLEEWFALAQNSSIPFSVIMFDLDNFKKLNDTYGHLKGDEVLVACSELVKASMRAKDIFARWGGEEFMILLPLTKLKNAADLAERLRSKIEEMVLDGEISVTASFGVAEFTPAESMEDFLCRLDSLMYKAKKSGKNRVLW